MSALHRNQGNVYLGIKVAILILASLLLPGNSCAESQLVLIKENTIISNPSYEAALNNARSVSVVSLSDNGDLMVKFGSASVLIAYNPSSSTPQSARTSPPCMAMNQETPSVNGISVRVHFTF